MVPCCCSSEQKNEKKEKKCRQAKRDDRENTCGKGRDVADLSFSRLTAPGSSHLFFFFFSFLFFLSISLNTSAPTTPRERDKELAFTLLFATNDMGKRREVADLSSSRLTARRSSHLYSFSLSTLHSQHLTSKDIKEAETRMS